MVVGVELEWGAHCRARDLLVRLFNLFARGSTNKGMRTERRKSGKMHIMIRSRGRLGGEEIPQISRGKERIYTRSLYLLKIREFCRVHLQIVPF